MLLYWLQTAQPCQVCLRVWHLHRNPIIITLGNSKSVPYSGLIETIVINTSACECKRCIKKDTFSPSYEQFCNQLSWAFWCIAFSNINYNIKNIFITSFNWASFTSNPKASEGDRKKRQNLWQGVQYIVIYSLHFFQREALSIMLPPVIHTNKNTFNYIYHGTDHLKVTSYADYSCYTYCIIHLNYDMT